MQPTVGTTLWAGYPPRKDFGSYTPLPFSSLMQADPLSNTLSFWRRFAIHLLKVIRIRRASYEIGRYLRDQVRPRTERQYVLGQVFIFLRHHFSFLAFQRRIAAREWVLAIQTANLTLRGEGSFPPE